MNKLLFPVQLTGCEYVQKSPHPYVRLQDLHLMAVCTPRHGDDVLRNGPRLMAFRDYKYSLGMFVVLSAFPLHLICHSFTLSRLFHLLNEHP